MDSVLLMVIIAPMLTFIYGRNYWISDSLILGAWDVLFSYILPAIGAILFWVYKSATPGKIVFKLTIADAKTGLKPTNKQFVGRYFAYFISMLPFFLEIIWVGFDDRKQGWHDKLAGTVVLRNTRVAQGFGFDA